MNVYAPVRQDAPFAVDITNARGCGDHSLKSSGSLHRGGHRPSLSASKSVPGAPIGVFAATNFYTRNPPDFQLPPAISQMSQSTNEPRTEGSYAFGNSLPYDISKVQFEYAPGSIFSHPQSIYFDFCDSGPHRFSRCFRALRANPRVIIAIPPEKI